jgi:hypothetical protein
MEQSSILEPEGERALAASLFNLAWTLLERTDRTPDDDDLMVHAAHASRYHWGRVGQPMNAARGEWQISRVYAVVGRSEPAKHHAQRCLDLCLQHGIGDFDLAYAYEALARASRVDGDAEAVNRYRLLAAEAGARIEEADDREQFEADLATL